MIGEKQNVSMLLSSIKSTINLYVKNDMVSVLNPVFNFINSLFCDCHYVEYWCLDLNFGKNTTETEMGYELRGIDTIEKFVDFLYDKRASNATKINLDIFQHHA